MANNQPRPAVNNGDAPEMPLPLLCEGEFNLASKHSFKKPSDKQLIIKQHPFAEGQVTTTSEARSPMACAGPELRWEVMRFPCRHSPPVGLGGDVFVKAQQPSHCTPS